MLIRQSDARLLAFVLYIQPPPSEKSKEPAFKKGVEILLGWVRSLIDSHGASVAPLLLLDGNLKTHRENMEDVHVGPFGGRQPLGNSIGDFAGKVWRKLLVDCDLAVFSSFWDTGPTFFGPAPGSESTLT